MLARKALAGTAGAPKEYVEDVFSTYLYTGTGSTLSIDNGIDLSTEGGLVWGKSRNGVATAHWLFDTARGATKYLMSQDTSGETTSSTTLTSFNSNGFTLGTSSFVNSTDTAVNNYVSWTFRKAKKFFDVVTYTGNGVGGRTVSHNLGSTPGCILIKSTSASADWAVWHRGDGTTAVSSLSLNTTDSSSTSTVTVNSTEFSTAITNYIGAGQNVNGRSYVAYLFAHDAGGFGDAGSDSIIKCGSYTGTGSNGTVIDLGWEPQWLLVKNADSAANWVLIDNMRGVTTGGVDTYLRPNTTNADDSTYDLFDFHATGFEPRGAFGICNAANKYIYIAIRRGPMKTPESGTEVFTPTSAVDTTQNAIINAGFPVDLVIGKTKNNTNPPQWCTRMLGGSYLLSSATDAETAWNYVFFDSNVGYRVNASGTYLNSANTVNWMLRRAPGFFDVVCYTGTGSNINVNHNLGVGPELVIVKRRNSTSDWQVAVKVNSTQYAIGASGDELRLNSTGGASTTYYTYSTYFNSTTFGTGAFWTPPNVNGATYVAYLFASVSGVSKVGSYTGNGSSQTINCGFTNGARFILIKRTDSTGRWYVWDTARGITASTDPYLVLNDTVAEDAYGSFDVIDYDSSGFIVNQTTNVQANVDTATYIYLAIA